MQLFNTTRFGAVAIDEEHVVTFSEGLPGFEETRRYAFLPHGASDNAANLADATFMWMQCVDEGAKGAGAIAFPVVSPWLIRQDYAPTVSSQALRDLGIDDIREQAQLWAIVTIPRDHPEQATVNLLAPVLINRQLRRGSQVVLVGDQYSLRAPIQPAPANDAALGVTSDYSRPQTGRSSAAGRGKRLAAAAV